MIEQQTERMRHVVAANATRAERLDSAWAADQVEDFPAAWAGRLLARWRKARPRGTAGANLALLKSTEAIRAAHRVGVPADANDGQICEEARTLARDTARRLDGMARAWSLELGDREPEQRDRLLMLGLLMEAMHWAGLRGVADKLIGHAYRSIRGTIQRARCERFWRRILRGIHATAVETTARAIGLVNKREGCYVSDESLKRRQGQNRRNEYALESVVALNEHGQDYTLAELAAKGPANRAIRRMELMTRIAGFELIAKECDHAAFFVTITCPSRMHAWRTKPGQAWGVEANPKHDGTTVEQAQRYLCRQWHRFTETCRRQGLELYGFRIAEPNHDGTPHWHALIFLPKAPSVGLLETKGRRVGMRHFDAGCMLGRNLRRYFLCGQDSTERGAAARRITIEPIDWARGSAAGYVAKYVAKNIDGYKVERDLYGNDTLTSSARVDAWASTHRIRQFQQIGGAPVGVWRELRRLHPEQAESSHAVALALEAVNVSAAAVDHEWEAAQRYSAANGFATYLHLQGGHRVRRAELRFRVLRESSGELGRYGEAMAPRAVGVVTVQRQAQEVKAFGLVQDFRRWHTVRTEVESERATWLVVPKGFVSQARARLEAPASRAARRPWSPVNNCTRPAPLFAGSVERIEKRGRWHRWEKGAGGLQPKESPTWTTPTPPNPSSPMTPTS